MQKEAPINLSVKTPHKSHFMDNGDQYLHSIRGDMRKHLNRPDF